MLRMKQTAPRTSPARNAPSLFARPPVDPPALEVAHPSISRCFLVADGKAETAPVRACLLMRTRDQSVDFVRARGRTPEDGLATAGVRPPATRRPEPLVA